MGLAAWLSIKNVDNTLYGQEVKVAHWTFYQILALTIRLFDYR